MPDFDIDFCQDRRDEVIQYVQKRYGKDKVAQIITFGKLQARAALRDVGRVLDMPYGQVDRIAKLIPNNPAKPTTIAQALDTQDELATIYTQDEQVATLVQTAMKLEECIDMPLLMQQVWLSGIDRCQSWFLFIGIRAPSYL